MNDSSPKMKKNIRDALNIYKLESEKQDINKILELYSQLDSSEEEKIKALVGQDGRIDLNKVPNIISPTGIAATAWYTNGWYLLPTENLCLMKKMLSFMNQYPRSNTKFQPEEYNAMICPALAEIFGLPSAKYYMAKKDGEEYMLTPDFLKEGEELIHIARIEEIATGRKQSTKAIQGSTKKISEMYSYLQQYLREYTYKGNKLSEE